MKNYLYLVDEIQVSTSIYISCCESHLSIYRWLGENVKLVHVFHKSRLKRSIGDKVIHIQIDGDESKYILISVSLIVDYNIGDVSELLHTSTKW